MASAVMTTLNVSVVSPELETVSRWGTRSSSFQPLPRLPSLYAESAQTKSPSAFGSVSPGARSQPSNLKWMLFDGAPADAEDANAPHDNSASSAIKTARPRHKGLNCLDLAMLPPCRGICLYGEGVALHLAPSLALTVLPPHGLVPA